MPTKWNVFVRKLSGGHYQTCFRAGGQMFTLAYVEVDGSTTDEDAKHHCDFIAKMFMEAMERLGAPPRDPGLES